MKCDEAQNLQGPYLDSELDAATTLALADHLKSCSECARSFNEEEKLQSWLKARLNQGQATPGLWERAERGVIDAARQSSFGLQAPTRPPGGGWASILSRICDHCRGEWRLSQRVWAGIGAAWIAILLLNVTARESPATQIARQVPPDTSALRLALAQKQRLLAELSMNSEQGASARPPVSSPGPHSERQTAAKHT